MLKTAIVVAATVCLASAAQLTCRVGAMSHKPDANMTCDTSNMGTYPHDTQPCDDETHSCLTAAYAGNWFAAYGCYPDTAIPATKVIWQRLCALDETCSRYNLNGVPLNGWQECKTDECNSCNAAAMSGPSAAVLLFGVICAAASLF